MTSTAPKTQTGTFHYQKKGLYSVIIFDEIEQTKFPAYSVYYHKEQYPMMYAFGLLKADISLNQCFDVAWGNLWDYKDMFN